MNYQELYNILIRVKNSIYLIPNYWTRQGYNLPNTLQAIDYVLMYWNTVNRDEAIKTVSAQLPMLNQRFMNGVSGLGALMTTFNAAPSMQAQMISTTSPFSTFPGGTANKSSSLPNAIFNQSNSNPSTLPIKTSITSTQTVLPKQTTQQPQPPTKAEIKLAEAISKTVSSTPKISQPVTAQLNVPAGQNNFNINDKSIPLKDTAKDASEPEAGKGDNLKNLLLISVAGAVIFLLLTRQGNDKKEKSLNGTDQQDQTTAKHDSVKGKTIHATI